MKKLFFTILLLILFFGLLPIAKADQKLLIDYPKIGEMDINKEGTTLPEIIKYIYLFSLGIVGLTAFVCIIIGAVKYITSAGNDSKMGDAKDRITSALLGILVLLASVLILTTINPDLINLEFNLPETQNQQNLEKHVACYCAWDSESEWTFQSGRCYATSSDCTAPCAELCSPGGFVGFCKINTTNCP